jgi:hypothetical protein
VIFIVSFLDCGRVSPERRLSCVGTAQVVSNKDSSRSLDIPAAFSSLCKHYRPCGPRPHPLEADVGISAARGRRWPTGADQGLVAVSCPAIDGRKDRGIAIALALPRLTATSSRRRGGVGPRRTSIIPEMTRRLECYLRYRHRENVSRPAIRASRYCAPDHRHL